MDSFPLHVFASSQFHRAVLADVSRTVPTGPGWAYEIKHDAFRFICRRNGDPVRLFSPGGHDLSAQLPARRLRNKIGVFLGRSGLILSLQIALVQFVLSRYAVVRLGGMADAISRFSRLGWEPSSHNVCPSRHIEPTRWPIANGLSYFELVLVHFLRRKTSGPGHLLWVGGAGQPGPKLLRMGAQEQLNFLTGPRPTLYYLSI